MKKIIFAILLIIVIKVEAQNDTVMPYKNSLRYEILPAFNSTFTLGFEQYCTPVSGLILMPSIMYQENDTYTHQGFIFEAQYRYHVICKVAHNGKSIYSYYVGPYVAAKFFSIEDSYQEQVWNGQYYSYVSVDYTDEFSAFGAGVIGGYEITFAKKLFIDSYIGGGIRSSDSDKNRDNFFSPGFRGIAPRIGFSIGVRF